MDYDKFESMIKKLEEYSKNHSKVYRFKVFLLALLGYGYIYTILALSITVLLAVVIIPLVLKPTSYTSIKVITKLGIPVLMFVILILKSLWIKLYPPKGIEVSSDECPELFNIIDEITKKLKSKKIHKILLSDTYNAGLYQYPKYGVFGNYENYLILGVPLMMDLSEEEFKGIIAHEIGHLSKNHNVFTGWIYRIKETWDKLMTNIEEENNRGKFLYKKFIDWYAPYFGAYTFVLRRNSEYEADRLASMVVGTQAKKNALLSGEVGSRLLDIDFWPEVYDRVEFKSEPPRDIYYEMMSFLKGNYNEKSTKYIAEALKVETGLINTHPSIKDRIKNINGDFKYTKSHGVKAFDKYFYSIKDRILDQLSSEWYDNILDYWKANYESIQEEKNYLSDLKKKSDGGKLTTSEVFEMGHLIEKYEDVGKALEIYMDVINKDKNHAKALYNIGRIYLDKKDEKGIDFVKKAMDIRHGFIIEGCILIGNYLMELDRKEEANSYYERAKEHERILELAGHEREKIRFSDTYCKPSLSFDEFDDLINKLKSYLEIKTVYLIQKELKYLKDFPLYAMFIELKDEYEDIDEDEFLNGLIDYIDFPEDIFIYVLKKDNKRVYDLINSVENSKIYDACKENISA